MGLGIWAKPLPGSLVSSLEMGEKGNEVLWQCLGGALCSELIHKPQGTLYPVTLAEWDLKVKMPPSAEIDGQAQPHVGRKPSWKILCIRSWIN